ncbi:hypothetical protein [Vibrio comitans]
MQNYDSYSEVEKASKLLTVKQAAYVRAATRIALRVEQDETDLEILNNEDKVAINYAVSRMSVTNGYFMSRGPLPLPEGGFNELNLRPFSELNVADEISYHLACMAVSIINQGWACFQAHGQQLLRDFDMPSKTLDEAVRLVNHVRAVSMTANLLEVK